MRTACIALAALILSPALACAAGPSGTATPAKPARSSMGSAVQSPVKCVDGTKSTNRSNACANHGGVDKAVQAALTEHASGGSNSASKGVLTTSAPPAKVAGR